VQVAATGNLHHHHHHHHHHHVTGHLHGTSVAADVLAAEHIVLSVIWTAVHAPS
jgi:hypothetical protein